ncbi:uncharacterized protein BXIN_2832 [Babesia sp. Xinjiang]|uniref:uncharacterized protein n=1 Tax=Babesia sp. Xinjiang TaxID=462227 RepID=UPI000A235AA3|nr:uncharacterized protein BXIN_2832 [Babesia sp. Xinjiang]ORM39379.1 hypothetical protein BXIN_2832 [Babesia sp. Xinjiang]
MRRGVEIGTTGYATTAITLVEAAEGGDTGVVTVNVVFGEVIQHFEKGSITAFTVQLTLEGRENKSRIKTWCEEVGGDGGNEFNRFFVCTQVLLDTTGVVTQLLKYLGVGKGHEPVEHFPDGGWDMGTVFLLGLLVLKIVC